MKRYLIPGFVAAAALALAACGSGGSSSSSGAARTGSGAALSVRQVDGVGKVLVDASGHALYTPDEEANGMVRCTGGCTAFWKPVAAGASLPATPAGVGTLGVVMRPDGTKQLTEGGKPLYTFVEDTSTTVKGNDFTDNFGGTHFTWRAVVAQGSASAPSTPTTSSSSGSGYGY
jgi:predicted lipoprotein with Yx(FWY)xxD motif